MLSFCLNYTGNTSEEEKIFGRDSTGSLSGMIILLMKYDATLSCLKLNIFPVSTFSSLIIYEDVSEKLSPILRVTMTRIIGHEHWKSDNCFIEFLHNRLFLLLVII